eukprot:3436110-Pyramimonas_sp.AAC.1
MPVLGSANSCRPWERQCFGRGVGWLQSRSCTSRGSLSPSQPSPCQQTNLQHARGSQTAPAEAEELDQDQSAAVHALVQTFEPINLTA